MIATLQQVKAASAKATFIVIVGGPATGKTFLSNQLDGPIIHADDYMHHGFERALYVLIDDLQTLLASGLSVVVEGVQAYRLLRKIEQQGNWKRVPDLIIECCAPKDVRALRLIKRGSNPNKSIGMDGMLQKIYSDYKLIIKKQPLTLLYDTE